MADGDSVLTEKERERDVSTPVSENNHLFFCGDTQSQVKDPEMREIKVTQLAGGVEMEIERGCGEGGKISIMNHLHSCRRVIY